MNKKLLREGPYADFFSQGLQVGNILTLAGQIGEDTDGKTPEDIKESIIHSYTSQTNKAKEHLYEYFVEHNMNQMMENIEDF